MPPSGSGTVATREVRARPRSRRVATKRHHDSPSAIRACARRSANDGARKRPSLSPQNTQESSPAAYTFRFNSPHVAWALSETELPNTTHAEAAGGKDGIETRRQAWV